MPTNYVELRCKTNFSFLQGASHPHELVHRAAELGYAALAITDVNSLAGVVRAHVAAQEAGLKLIVGAEITPIDAPPVLLYSADLAAYQRLSGLITQGRRAAPKGECRLGFDDVAAHAEGLLAAVVPAGPDDLVGVRRYREVFQDRCFLALALHCGPDDERALDAHVQLADKARTPLVAVNDVHYHVPERRPLHDVLTAIRHGTTVAELGRLRFPNGERHLKPIEQMANLFRRRPSALVHGLELADRCHFSLKELRYEPPEELCPPTETPTSYLTRLTWEGARKRYPEGIPDKVADLLQRELALIKELHYEGYFIVVWDLVRFAKSLQILCQGRGSAANSAVCYCLGITAVDPNRIDCLFERFISRERNEPPDIDVDFEHERREAVMQYIYTKYGRDRAGIVAEVITYRSKSAVRDVGKALGLSLDRIDRLSKNLDLHGDGSGLAARTRESGLDPRSRKTVQLLRLAAELVGFPRHLSQHVGGFVLTHQPLWRLAPIENALMKDRSVIQWDKDDIDILGILKVDCLSLGMLTAIRKCFDLIKKHGGNELTLASIPPEDPQVYDMIGKADTIGVFQIESRAQMSALPRYRPRNYFDLVVQIAIIRPGPIQGGMVHPLLRRRCGLEPVTYPSPEVEAVLSKTLGIPIFQEQVMRLAITLAGFTPGEADQLRRVMGKWDGDALKLFRTKLRDRMLARGLPTAFAEQVFEQVRGFSQYGFPESHAASFALLVYVSAWLKYHYPAEFCTAIINSQPMGFYSPSQLVQDAKAHKVDASPVDVNHSEWDCSLEGTEKKTIRLGFRLVEGLPQTAADAIVAARMEGPFQSISDCSRRTRIGRPVLARLAAADAFSSIGLDRRQSLWQVLSTGDELPLFAGLECDDPIPQLPDLPLDQHVVADYETVGLSLRAHPIGLVRNELDRLGVTTAADLLRQKNKSPVRVGGLVTVRQHPPTARGVVFMTLEDETGSLNLVLWKKIWERFRQVGRNATALLVRGKVERTGGVTHVLASELEDLSHAIRGLASQSRDFR